MIRLTLIAVLVILLSLSAVAVTSASGDPVGSCPNSFQPHPVVNHDDHHGHQHVGSDTDRNGDGWICVKHVSVDGDIHVHIDNNARVR